MYNISLPPRPDGAIEEIVIRLTDQFVLAFAAADLLTMRCEWIAIHLADVEVDLRISQLAARVFELQMWRSEDRLGIDFDAQTGSAFEGVVGCPVCVSVVELGQVLLCFAFAVSW